MSCLPEPAITSCDSGHWIPLWQLSIGHFRVPPGLCIKTRLGAQLFLWKWVLFAWEWKIISISKIEHLTSFWCRGPGELANGLLNITWMSNRPFPHYPPVSKHNKEMRTRLGEQFHTNQCILSTRASSWCLCLRECREGLYQVKHR